MRTGISTWHLVGFFLKNQRGEILGGVTGHVWGGWMHVAFLWVTEMLRGQGHGTRLMDAAEIFAIERGATSATLETMSFPRCVRLGSVRRATLRLGDSF